MGTLGVHKKGSIHGWFVVLVLPVIEIFVLLWFALAGPEQQIFFPHLTLLHFICPHRQQAGQAVVPRRLSLNMCLRSQFVVYPLCRRDGERDLLAVDLLGAAQGGSSLPRLETSQQPRPSRPRLLIVPASQQPRSSRPRLLIVPAS